ncbi:sugar phosphate isomerase/epimerase [Mucilaginibacter sp. UR6-1]|uniref:sugar phosphate isomerase/epimerase family protein n=1 Tax=Mucilaginibacter sp. UR6-1 TaxID=1435643 RepID=UPI001E645847|nr:sugar phosphate isomerase/epimerase [Mucilaginibacter sp. UR6-1]MCC8410199.1 sugar phosphate isomerase/epimerase [Mucilaginibacter sp. UR6-1]
MTNRRIFLGQAGLLGAAMLLRPDLSSAKGVSKVGLQLYSLRDYLPKDVKGVTEKIAKAGYKEVETYGYSKQNGFWGLDAKAYGQLLKANGLVSPSGHYGIESYFRDGSDKEINEAIEAAKIIGSTYVILPWMGGELIDTVDKCKAMAQKFNKAGEMVKKAGLKFGYHNHNFEWKPVGDTSFYDVLLKETDVNLVTLELDLYWVYRSNLDPVKMLNENPNRFKLVHVKDADKANKELNTEVGKGLIDYKAIFAAAQKAGVKHFIVEQENFTNIDPYVSIGESISYVKTLSI